MLGDLRNLELHLPESDFLWLILPGARSAEGGATEGYGDT